MKEWKHEYLYYKQSIYRNVQVPKSTQAYIYF